MTLETAMPSSSPSNKAPAPRNAPTPPVHTAPPAVYGYADEAPFGDIVKDPTPVPTTPPGKASDEAEDES